MLGPPFCKKCNYWAVLSEGRTWYCPVCKGKHPVDGNIDCDPRHFRNGAYPSWHEDKKDE